MAEQYVDGKSGRSKRAGDDCFQPGNMIDQWIGNQDYRNQQQDDIEHMGGQ